MPDIRDVLKTDFPDYFDPKYVESRHGYVGDLREFVKRGSPEPQSDWDAIYVFSGPELTLQSDERPPTQPKNLYNQTLERLKTGFEVAQKVTRCRSGYSDVEALRHHGPMVYFDGSNHHNDNLRKIINNRGLEQRFAYPDDKISILNGNGSAHTGEQIERFPRDVIFNSRKIVFVSDLYHLPRISRYIGSGYDIFKFPANKLILYAVQKSRIPMRAAIGEARKIYLYELAGYLNRKCCNTEMELLVKSI